MQTLEKPKGGEEESRKSSTCQPGSISIKYSDMLLVEPPPSLANRLSPLLLLITAAAAVVVLINEDLASEDGLKFAGQAEIGFLTNG